MKTIGVMSFTTTFDWDNSFLGLVNSLRQSYKEKKQLEDAEELRERLRVVCNEFCADLKISGFENCSDLEIARFLEQEGGIEHKILMDKNRATYDINEGSCVLPELSVFNSMLYMKSLRGQEFNDVSIETHCTIHLMEPVIETTSNGELINTTENENDTTDDSRAKEKKSLVQKFLPKLPFLTKEPQTVAVVHVSSSTPTSSEEQGEKSKDEGFELTQSREKEKEADNSVISCLTNDCL